MANERELVVNTTIFMPVRNRLSDESIVVLRRHNIVTGAVSLSVVPSVCVSITNSPVPTFGCDVKADGEIRYSFSYRYADGEILANVTRDTIQRILSTEYGIAHNNMILVDRSFVASMRRRLVKAVPSLFRWLVFGKPKHFMEFARGE